MLTTTQLGVVPLILFLYVDDGLPTMPRETLYSGRLRRRRGIAPTPRRYPAKSRLRRRAPQLRLMPLSTPRASQALKKGTAPTRCLAPGSGALPRVRQVYVPR